MRQHSALNDLSHIGQDKERFHRGMTLEQEGGGEGFKDAGRSGYTIRSPSRDRVYRGKDPRWRPECTVELSVQSASPLSSGCQQNLFLPRPLYSDSVLKI